MYICVCVCMCVRTHVCTYLCMYERMYVCTYVRMYVCTYVCMYVRTYVCMYVRMYICTYVRVCTYVYMYVCTHVCTYLCMYERMYVPTYVCMYVRMYVCTYVCMYYKCVIWCILSRSENKAHKTFQTNSSKCTITCTPFQTTNLRQLFLRHLWTTRAYRGCQYTYRGQFQSEFISRGYVIRLMSQVLNYFVSEFCPSFHTQKKSIG